MTKKEQAFSNRIMRMMVKHYKPVNPDLLKPFERHDMWGKDPQALSGEVEIGLFWTGGFRISFDVKKKTFRLANGTDGQRLTDVEYDKHRDMVNTIITEFVSEGYTMEGYEQTIQKTHTSFEPIKIH